jgi:alginate O-acetyltransferase complex protein AlgI
MAYSSDAFVLFLPVILTAFYLVGNRAQQNALLVVVSLGFLGWTGVSNVIVAVAMIGVALSYLQLEPAARERFFPWALAVLLLNLVFFKYRQFIAGTFGITLPVLPGLVWAVPLGISFYTFQIIAGLHDASDVEGDNTERPIQPGRFALFVLFFPHLIAGPICRIGQLYRQFTYMKRFAASRLASGLQLFTLGYCKKVLIADPLARAIDPLWASANVGSLSSGLAWAAVIGFYVQVYADFSGYTDMGRGVARALGFRLPCNFRAPYLAATPAEFWSRWHITLSNFAKGLIYTPLAVAMARRFRSARKLGMLISLIATMVLLGLWHGAAWRFVLFGLIQGVLLAMWYGLTKAREIKSTLALITGIVATQGLLVLSFVVFRAETPSATLGVFASLFGFGDGQGAAMMPAAGLATLVLGATAVVFAIQAFDYFATSRRIAAILLLPRRIPLTGFLIAFVLVLAFMAKRQLAGVGSAGFERFI